jgi:hypothetical protein
MVTSLWVRFEPRISWIWSRSANHWTVTFGRMFCCTSSFVHLVFSCPAQKKKHTYFLIYTCNIRCISLKFQLYCWLLKDWCLRVFFVIGYRHDSLAVNMTGWRLNDWSSIPGRNIWISLFTTTSRMTLVPLIVSLLSPRYQGVFLFGYSDWNTKLETTSNIAVYNA